MRTVTGHSQQQSKFPENILLKKKKDGNFKINQKSSKQFFSSENAPFIERTYIEAIAEWDINTKKLKA